MKETFKEYFKPAEAEKKAIWENGIIIFDTNILLNLYRFSTETRDDLLSQMEAYSDQLWLPYQIGLEYFENRECVINELPQAFKELETKLNEGKNAILKCFDDHYSRHPMLNKGELTKEYDKAIKSFRDKLESWKKSTPNYMSSDPIKEKLLDLYKEKTGKDLTDEELESVYIEGAERYAEKIPPGFKDLKRKQGKSKRHIYGDLIIWKQIIKYAASSHKDIVFVTQDVKEDWWVKKDGKADSPLYALLREFHKQTGQQLLMYQQEGFMKAAKKKTTKPESIKEVKQLTQEDKIRTRNLEWIDHLAGLQGWARLLNTTNSPVSPVSVTGPALSTIQSVIDYQESRQKMNDYAKALTGIPIVSELVKQNPALQAQRTLSDLISSINLLNKK